MKTGYDSPSLRPRPQEYRLVIIAAATQTPAGRRRAARSRIARAAGALAICTAVAGLATWAALAITQALR